MGNAGETIQKEWVERMSQPVWHYLWQNQQYGPVPEAELRRHFEEGRLHRETLVWSPGMAQWIPAIQVAAFQPHPAGRVAASAAPAQVLAPSEVVFFHAERFASPGGALSNNVELVHLPQKVKAGELGQAIMATAFLAAEREGAIRLALTEKKGLFGLKTTKVVEVSRGSAAVIWPADTFESGIAAMVQQGSQSVESIVYALLQSDTTIPAAAPYWLMQASLTRKGLLTAQEKKGFLGSGTTQYFVTPQAQQLAAASDSNGWLRLLGETQQGRFDLWTALTAGIQAGFNRRQESSSSGPDLPDFD